MSREEVVMIFFKYLSLQADDVGGGSAVGVETYQTLCEHIARVLYKEELRCGYLSQQQQVMWTVQDDMAARTEADSIDSPYRAMLEKSSLAQTLKKIYDR